MPQTQYTNKGTITSVSGSTVSVNSNEVVSEKLADPTIVKSQGLEVVSNSQSYSYTVKNNNTLPINNVIISDTLPAGMTYVPSSLLVNGNTATPTAATPSLIIKIPVILGGATATISFDVAVA